LQAGDFSEGTLARKAPAKPKRKTTWKDLFAVWRRKTGGTLEVDGYGVSEDRDAPYLVSIREFEAQISQAFPAELTIEDGRRYVRWLQEESGQSIRTQQGRLGCLRNLLKIGKQDGLLDENVFADLKISTPSGAEDESGYRPFTRAEVIDIFTLLTAETDEAKQYLHYILLCTGCRLSEVIQLRTKDIMQTEAGVWYINWVHEPTGEYPMRLKTKAQNNRQIPLHPRLIEQGLLKINRSHNGRLFPIERSRSAYSIWFKQKLKRLGIWEPRKTVLHSLRGTARDLWREANISQDFRNAFTGHKSKEVGESSYGLGLNRMPDTTFEQLKKVDLSWLP
jgi:integrase